jgi:hypothetical protein
VLSPERVESTQGQLTQGQLASAAEAAGSEEYEPAVIERMQNNPAIDMIYDDLNPIDQLVLDYSFGRNGRPKLSTQAIAKKLRVTPGAVSQRASKIQRSIDELTDMELF